jgi:protein SCO1/2
MAAWRGLIACLAGAAALAGCGASKPGPPLASAGTAVDSQVPAAIANAPLTDDTGHATSLAAYRGKIVVLTDFLTLCQDVCPLTSANFAQMNRAVTAAHLQGQVQFIELTVDPQRDTPARLHAYRKLFNAPPNWALLTASPQVITQVWKYFGAWYQKGPEDSPPGIDWWTGKPLTYDVDHQDILVFLDSNGHERFLIQGPPNTRDHLPPAKLDQFLNDLGRTHLNHPASDAWTVPQALQPLSWLTGVNLQAQS